MPTTPNAGLPYPAASAVPDIPGDLYALAAAIDGGTLKSTPWQAYAPALTGISGGSGGSVVLRWRWTAGEIEMRVAITLGSGGFVNGDIAFPLPVTATRLSFYDAAGQVIFLKSGGTPSILGRVIIADTTASLRPNTVSGSYVTEGVASSTVPFTWGNGDAVFARLRYTPA